MSDTQYGHVQHLGSVPPRRQVSFLLGLGIFFLPQIFVWFLLRRGYSTVARVIGFIYLGLSILLFFAMLGAAGPMPEQASADEAAPAADVPAQAVTSRELAEAYDRNEVAAQKQYGDQVLEVSGTVKGVTLDFMDNPTLQLDGLNDFQAPQASFDKEFSDAIGKVSKGDKVVIRCAKVMEVASIPQLSGCTL